MNPVLPISAHKAGRAAAASLLYYAAYRCVTGRYPGHSHMMRVNSVLSLALCLDLATTFSGQSTIGYPGMFTRMRGGTNAIALTFDDGPSPDSTPELLAILKDADAKATFFMLGEEAARYPELVDLVLSDGHAVAIHGFTHEALALKRGQSICRQINRTRQILGIYSQSYFRPPFGFKSLTLLRACQRTGVRLTTWSVNPKDYLNPSPEILVERINRALHDGAVVLLHEWPACTRQALPHIIKSVREKGYTLTALPTLRSDSPSL